MEKNHKSSARKQSTMNKESYLHQIEKRKSRVFSVANRSQKLINASADVFEGFDEWCLYENSKSNATSMKWLDCLDEKMFMINGMIS